jgi:enoyl-CoA hydratase
MPDDMRFEVSDTDHVGVLTLARPEARNALRRQTYRELESIVRGLADAGVRCLVITGDDPAFCSGDDVKLIMAGPERPTEELETAPRLTPAADALLHTDVPVVAAVNGAAVGWGMELALMADIRVASERARFGELFVLRGLVSDVPGLARLAQLVGREHAAELLFTGEIIDAAKALRIGLVSRVVAHDELLAAATDVARRIAAGRAGVEERPAPGARSGLGRAGPLGVIRAGPPLPDGGPPRGSGCVPREAPAELRRQVNPQPSTQSPKLPGGASPRARRIIATRATLPSSLRCRPSAPVSEPSLPLRADQSRTPTFARSAASARIT